MLGTTYHRKGLRGWSGAGPRGRRLDGRGPGRPRPLPPALSPRLQVCEAAVGAENLAPQPAPHRARPAPGSMGPPLCAARPAPRRARSPPCGQVKEAGGPEGRRRLLAGMRGRELLGVGGIGSRNSTVLGARISEPLYPRGWGKGYKDVWFLEKSGGLGHLDT